LRQNGSLRLVRAGMLFGIAACFSCKMYMHASLELHANASKSERDAEYDNKKTEQNGRHGFFRTGECATRSSPPRASCVTAAYLT
jgi:hypothetical protein